MVGKTLEDVDKAIQNCQKCGDLVEKFTNSTSISFGGNSNIVILGEAPANNGWRKSGRAWYSPDGKMLQSGKILNKLLNIIGVELDDTIFLEAIKCYPKARKNLKTCSANCQEYLLMQLSVLNPELIITLGDAATKALLNFKNSKFGEVVGKIYPLKIAVKEIKILPIYHPSPISPVGYKGNVPIFNKLKKEQNYE